MRFYLSRYIFHDLNCFVEKSNEENLSDVPTRLKLVIKHTSILVFYCISLLLFDKVVHAVGCGWSKQVTKCNRYSLQYYSDEFTEEIKIKPEAHSRNGVKCSLFWKP